MEDPKLNQGDPVVVKINGVPVKATYLAWSEKYNLAVVDVGGKKLYRKLFTGLEPQKLPDPDQQPQVAAPSSDPRYGRVELHSDGYHHFDGEGKFKFVQREVVAGRRSP